YGRDRGRCQGRAACVGGTGAISLNPLSRLCLRLPGRIVDGVERGAEQGLDPVRLRAQPLTLGDRIARDPARLRMGLLEDERRLATSLVAQLVRRLLRSRQCRAKQRLELAVALEVGLELLDPVGEVGPLAPDGLERVGHLLDRLVDGTTLIAEQAALEADVSELNWCKGHDGSSFLVRSC